METVLNLDISSVGLCMISINAGIMAALCFKVVENAYLYSTGTDLSMRLIDLIDKSVGDRDHLTTSRHVM